MVLFYGCFSQINKGVVHSGGEEADIGAFPVHFAVVCENMNCLRISETDLRAEVEILNRYFRGVNGERPVEFFFQSASLVSSIMDSPCALLSMSQDGNSHDSNDWASAVNGCMDERVVALDAINFIVVDSHDPQNGYSDVTSRGRLNGGRPYVLLDWARLGHVQQSPEEHEMGHAFALDHVCVDGATLETPTNIMASAGLYVNSDNVELDCSYSGGLRNIGFSSQQLLIIQNSAILISDTLEF